MITLPSRTFDPQHILERSSLLKELFYSSVYAVQAVPYRCLQRSRQFQSLPNEEWRLRLQMYVFDTTRAISSGCHDGKYLADVPFKSLHPTKVNGSCWCSIKSLCWATFLPSCAQCQFISITYILVGQNFALNMAQHGFKVCVGNRSQSKVTATVERAKQEGNLPIIGSDSPKQFIEKLKEPRKVIILVQAGKPVDETIAKLSKYMEPGDLIVDGGNEWFPNSIRRAEELEKKGIMFIGMGNLVKECCSSRGWTVYWLSWTDWSWKLCQNGTQWYRIWWYATYCGSLWHYAYSSRIFQPRNGKNLWTVEYRWFGVVPYWNYSNHSLQRGFRNGKRQYSRLHSRQDWNEGAFAWVDGIGLSLACFVWGCLSISMFC